MVACVLVCGCEHLSTRHRALCLLRALFLHCCAGIYFANNPVTGALVLLCTLAGDWYMGVAMAVGVVSATAAAHALAFDAESRRSGLLGYAGALTAQVCVPHRHGPGPRGTSLHREACGASLSAPVSVRAGQTQPRKVQA